MSALQERIAWYNNNADEYSKEIEHSTSDFAMQEFFGYIQPTSLILDVGCAAGRDSRIFKDAGFEPIGIDASSELLTIASRQNPDICFVQGDQRSLPFEENTFGGIWSVGVFHHLERAEMIHTLAELSRVTEPQGKILIRTKMGNGILTDVDFAGIQRSFTLLSLEELMNLGLDAGLKIVSSHIAKEDKRDVTWANVIFEKDSS